MKKLLLLVIHFLSIFGLMAQSITVPFKLVRQVVNGIVTEASREYLFLTISDKVCYDSDRAGYAVGNGTLRLSNKGEQYLVYEGESFYGQSIYRIRNDYYKLNVEDVSSGIIYVYESCNIPSSISTCTRVKSTLEQKKSNILPSISESQNFNVPISEPRQKMRCSGCEGTGLMKVHVGVSTYSVDVTYKCNVCNDVMHTYDHHIHQTCSACYGTGFIER